MNEKGFGCHEKQALLRLGDGGYGIAVSDFWWDAYDSDAFHHCMPYRAQSPSPAP